MGIVFRINLQAKPKPGSNHDAEFGGAYVNVWMRADSDEEAVRRTIASLSKEGWEVVGLPQVWTLQDRASTTDRQEAKNYDRAMKTGPVFEYGGWPPGD